MLFERCKAFNNNGAGDIGQVRTIDIAIHEPIDLPKEAREYLELIEEQLDVPVAIVSVGPKRDNTVVVEDPIHGPKRVLSKQATANV